MASFSFSRKSWFSIPEIRALPVEARGLYVELLIIANESFGRRGYLETADRRPLSVGELALTLSVERDVMQRTIDNLLAAGLLSQESGSGVYFFPEIVAKEARRLQRAQKMAEKKTPTSTKIDNSLEQRVEKLESDVAELKAAVAEIGKAVGKLTVQVKKLTKAIKRTGRKKSEAYKGNGHSSTLERSSSEGDVFEQVAALKAAKEREEIEALSNSSKVQVEDQAYRTKIEAKRKELLAAFQAEAALSGKDGGTDSGPAKEVSEDEEVPPWPQPKKEPVDLCRLYKNGRGWSRSDYIRFAELPEVKEALERGDPLKLPIGGIITPEMPCYRYPNTWMHADKVLKFRQDDWKEPNVVIPFDPIVDPPRPDGSQEHLIDRRPVAEKVGQGVGGVPTLPRATAPLIGRPVEQNKSQEAPARLFPDIPPKSTKLKSTPIVEADPDDGSEEMLLFPTKGDSQYWRMRKDLVDKLQERYPDINVYSELVKALSWVEAHQERRKTARGMMKFVIGWLNRCSTRLQTLNQRPHDWRIDGYKPVRHPDDIKYSL